MNPQSHNVPHIQADATPAGVPPDAAAEVSPDVDMQVREVPESVLDDAIEATFPASDPVAVISIKTLPADSSDAPGAKP